LLLSLSLLSLRFFWCIFRYFFIIYKRKSRLICRFRRICVK
jgi:hypothetical protein